MDDILSGDIHIHTCLRPVDDGAQAMSPRFIAEHYRARGMRSFGLSPHVHQDADFAALADFLQSAKNIARAMGMEMKAGVETECTDARGTLTLPSFIAEQLDYVIASADHFNCAGVVQPPREAHACMQFHLDLLLTLAAHPLVDVIAHPLAGMILLTTEGHMPGYEPIERLDDVTDDWVREFARLARANRTAVELNGYFTLTYPASLASQGRPSYLDRYLDIYRILAENGVTLVASSDAHTPESLAQYDHAAKCLRALGA